MDIKLFITVTITKSVNKNKKQNPNKRKAITFALFSSIGQRKRNYIIF